MRWRALLLSLLCGLLVACDSTDSPLPRQSVWGTVYAIAEAAQRDAPAINIARNVVIIAWTQVEDGAVLHMTRQFDGTKSTLAQALPIPTAYPFAQSWAVQSDGGAHLFWLDAVFDNPTGDTLLWLARVDRNLEMPRNHVRLGEVRVDDYATLPVDDERTRVVFSGGARGEPSLYTLTVDTIGRPTFPHWLTSDVRFPRLVLAADSQQMVYWVRASNGQVMRAQLNTAGLTPTLQDITPLVDGLTLESGDRLISFDVTFDNTHAYLLWNLTRADGTPETWLATGNLADATWRDPSPLTIGTATDTPFVTGFNGGDALTISAGEIPVTRAQPANGRFDVAPIIAQVGDSLRVIYLQAGQVVAVQRVVDLGVPLVGVPRLTIDQNRHLYVAWAEPTPNGSAALNLTSTRTLIGDVRE